MSQEETLNTLREGNLIDAVSLFMEAKTGEIELIGLLPPETLQTLLLLKVQIDSFIRMRTDGQDSQRLTPWS